MPNDRMVITTAVLSWARQRAGYSLESLEANFLKIREWESGASGPTYPQLEALAEKLGVPVAAFFLPQPPILPPIRESFRTLPDADYQKLPPSMLALLRRAKAMQLNLSELCDGANPAQRLITRDLDFSANLRPSQAAERIRAFLDVSINDQASWRDAEVALKSWRKAIHTVGVFVFKDAFHANDYSGFSLYDDVFPVIYINNSTTKTRQTFTLFHELVHLLLHTSAIDTPDDHQTEEMSEYDRGVEIFCNKVANEVLVPRTAFAAAMRGRQPSRQSAEDLANQFSVSREVIYRHFLDREWISAAEYQDAVREWTSQIERAGSGGDYYWTKIAYLGDSYIDLALKQYAQNRFDDERLGEYLDMKPRNVESLIERFQRLAR